MNTKEELKKKEAQLIDMVSNFCTSKVNEEYAQLCAKLVKKLGRKRDIPFKSGKLEIWAAAVVYAIGTINFLFDKSFPPYISVEQLNEYFGTKGSTVSAKGQAIKKMFDLWHFNPEFSTNSMEERNPFNKMVMVDGFIVPVDTLPLNLQKELADIRAQGGDMEFYTKKS